MREITIATPFVEQTLLGARAAGYDVDRILTSSGIAPELLDQPRGRVTVDNFVRLLQRLMRQMDDEAIGLLDRPLRPGSFELIARSALHELTIGDAILRYAQSATLLNPGLIHDVELHAAQARLVIRRRSGVVVRSVYALESTLLTLHRFMCWLCRRRLSLVRVDLDYPPPAWSAEYRYLFYGAPVRFRQPQLALSFSPGEMDWRVTQNVTSLTRYIARAPRDIFNPLASPAVGHRAREHVLKSLRGRHGVPRAGQTAAALGLTPQTFWRRLQAEGTDYTRVRTEARRDLAVRLLDDGELRIERIAEQLGYSESSAFIRAFRGWTGLTPLAYRRAQRIPVRGRARAPARGRRHPPGPARRNSSSPPG